MKKTVAFGEVLLRLSPPGSERFMQSPVLGATFGGGEANVALSLAGLGLESSFVTRVPAHAVGDAALRALAAEGVRTQHIARGGERLGRGQPGAGGRAPREPRLLADNRRAPWMRCFRIF